MINVFTPPRNIKCYKITSVETTMTLLRSRDIFYTRWRFARIAKRDYMVIVRAVVNVTRTYRLSLRSNQARGNIVCLRLVTELSFQEPRLHNNFFHIISTSLWLLWLLYQSASLNLTSCWSFNPSNPSQGYILYCAPSASRCLLGPIYKMLVLWLVDFNL